MQAFKNLFRKSKRKKANRKEVMNDDQGTVMETTSMETETKGSKLRVAESARKKKPVSVRSKHNERTDTVIGVLPGRDSQQEKTGGQEETKSMMPQLSTMSVIPKAASQRSAKKNECKTTMLPVPNTNRAFIDNTLSRGIKGLTQDFRSRKRALDKNAMAEFYKQNPEGRNRYKDVGCLDNSRVILHLGPVPYIHANYVSTPSNPKKFICTQAPVAKTIPEFWYMVVQEKSAVILMLCNMFERGANKCSQYFPPENGGPLTFEGITVTAKGHQQMNLQTSTSAKIMVTQLEVVIPGLPSHACSHYHWQDWPDRGVPEADMAPIQLLKNLNDHGAPIIVHCSAGIGRTGSIVLLQHVMELMAAGQELDPTLLNYLDELRKQRNNSIQTEQQYFYVHQVMLMHLRQLGLMEDKVYKEAMLRFTIEYQKATTAFGA